MDTNNKSKLMLTVKTKVHSDVITNLFQKMNKSDGTYIANYNIGEIEEITESINLNKSELLELLLNTKVEIIENDKYIKCNLFSKYEIINNYKVKLFLSNDINYIADLDETQYVIINATEYNNLPDINSKNLYKSLRQFRYSGVYLVSKSELLQMFNTSQDLDEYVFIKSVILPAIEANKVYFQNLSVNIIDIIPEVIKFNFKPYTRLKIKQKSKLDEQNDKLQQYIEENQT